MGETRGAPGSWQALTAVREKALTPGTAGGFYLVTMNFLLLVSLHT